MPPEPCLAQTTPDDPGESPKFDQIYLMSFQKAALRRQAITVKPARNNNTQTPSRTRAGATTRN